jgi:hypothetical protein
VKHSDEETLRFVAASFTSVWGMELLFLLKCEGERCSRSMLVEQLRASEIVVSKSLDALVAAGLVSVEGDHAIYLPVSPDVGEKVDRAEQLYRSRPNAVRRAIVAAGSNSATAFSDAFKLRRDKDD